MSYSSNMETPLGNVQITATDQLITSILFGEPLPINENTLTKLAQSQLEAYFAGELIDFDLPLAMNGTAFQQRVWEQVNRIPYGGSAFYSTIAEDAGNGRAVRAAASAVGRNTFAIVIPCHRVVGRNSIITGYRWGPWRKNWLLEFEQQRSRC